MTSVTVYISATAAAAAKTIAELSDTYATPPATDYYRVLYADAKTGVVYGELPTLAFSWSETLNGAGTISVDVPVRVDNPSPAFTAENLRPGATTLWVVRDGVILFGGMLTAKQAIDVGANRATLSGVGFHGYMRRRHIRSDLVFAGVDQFTIAQTLIDLAAGDVRVVTGSDTSGRTRSRTYLWHEMKPIAEAIEDLAATDDGFDFRYTYAFVDNVPTPTFTTTYPNTGNVTSIRLDVGSNCSLASLEQDGTQLGNTAITLGAADNDVTPMSVVTDPAGLSGRPIFESVESFPQITDPDTLDEHGRDRIKKLGQPIDRMTVILYQGMNPSLGTFRPGDQVTVTGSLGWWQASGTYRITGYAATVVDGGETVTVDVAPLEVFT